MTILTLSLRGVYHWGVMDALENAKREVLSILGFFSIKIVGNNSITSQNSWIKQKCQAVPRSYLKEKTIWEKLVNGRWKKASPISVYQSYNL